MTAVLNQSDGAVGIGRSTIPLRHRLPGVVHAVVVVAISVFLLIPLVIVVLASFSESAYLTFPPRGFSLRWYEAFFANSSFMQALGLSVRIAILATMLSVVLGLLTALAVERMTRRWAQVTTALAAAPLLIPQVTLGIALLIVFSRLRLAGTFEGLVIAHTLVALPFTVLLIGAALRSADRSVEEAARNLGASPARTVVTITIPQISSSIAGAAFFAFIMSFDEVTVSLFLSGPRTETLPIKIFGYVEYQTDPTIAAISTLLILVAAVGAVLMARFSNLTNYLERR